MLHGRLLAALAARSAETAGHPFTPVRITVDLFRAAPLEPVEVITEMVRDGGRVRVVLVGMACAGRDVARASVLLLRSGSGPEGRVWTPSPWSVPAPDEVGSLAPGTEAKASLDIRLITEGGLLAVTQKRLWIREVQALVEGEEPSPFVRAVAAADLANPFGNFGDQGLSFINADLTVYLGRLPVGEWIGLEVASRTAAAGVATVAANLHDSHGAIGHCSAASVASLFGGPPTDPT
jgi:Acyl-CoA thioesterase C-terminal domain/Acyl-CoA thioesterase N-terminal domain